MNLNYFSAFVVIIFFSFNSLAQVTPAFTSNKIEGCAPLSVNFTDQSTGNVQTRAWNFGNGQTSSSTANNPTPLAQYLTPGTYDVTLVINEGLADEETLTIPDYITVYANPVANFSATDTAGCSPFNVDFTNLSSSAGANIASWSWAFNDLSPVDVTNYDPSHTFSNNGSYGVVLSVVDDNGCTDDTTITFTVAPPPVNSFSANPTLSCEAPLDVTFTNNSTAGLNYNWDFGDGQTSTAFDPGVITYSNLGIYDVALTVSDPNGCDVVLSSPGMIQITDVLAGVTATNGCVGVAVPFDNSATVGANTYSWDFGDATSGTGNNPSHAYAAPGSYTVTLIATNSAAGCSDTATVQVDIEDFTAAFSLTPVYGCEAPMMVTFTDLSGSGTSVAWQWSLGNGTSTVQNPVNAYSTEGTYNIILNVTSTNGCVSQSIVNNALELSFPEADFNILYPPPGEVCIDAMITLTDNSTADVNGTLTNWQWDFGDGNTASNATGANVTNLYTNDGEFNASLTVTNAAGCKSIFSDEVEIGDKLNPDFTVTPTVSCARDEIEYSGFTDDDSKVDDWQWQGTGGFGGSNQVYTHTYDDTSAIGFNDAMLIVTYNGCKDTIEKTNVVEIIGPIVAGQSIAVLPLDCNDPYSRTFTVIFIDATSYEWDFGDGTITTVNNTLNEESLTITHIYPAGVSSDYGITFSTWNNNAFPFDGDSCVYQGATSVKIRKPKAEFSVSKSPVCNLENIQFAATASVDDEDWKWDFGDGITIPYSSTLAPTVTPANFTNTSGTLFDQPIHKYNNRGTYDVILTVIDANGCEKDTTISVRVFKPVADISTDTTRGCIPNFTFNFSDATYDRDTTIIWAWKYNNVLVSNDSADFHTMNDSCAKPLNLSVVDAIGCTSSKTINVEGMKPYADFTVTDQTICVGVDTIQFSSISTVYSCGATSSDSITLFDWRFGNGESSLAVSPQYAYALSGTYTDTLIIRDNFGCRDTVIKQDFIDVQELPIANFVADDTAFTCYQPAATANFTSTSASSDIDFYLWNLNANGFQLTTSGVVTQSYTSPGSYDASLIVVTTYGCRDTLIKEDYINITGPYVEFSVDRDTICVNDTVTFTLDSLSNVFGWEWSFGADGASNNGDTVVSFVYSSLPLTGSSYSPSIIIYSEDSVCKPKFDTIIFIYQVQADFTMNGLNTDMVYSCPDFNVDFVDASVGVVTWDWDFGNGTTATGNTGGSETYTPGLYEITLAVESNASAGCIDTARKYVRVYEDPVLTIHNDTNICLGDLIGIWVAPDTLSQYVWTPAEGLSDDSIHNPLARPKSEDVTYTVNVVDINGCEASADINITALAIPEPEVEIETNPIYIGDSTNINVIMDGDGYTYNWRPVTDINCSDCPTALFNGIYTTTYLITVTDENGVCPPQVDTATVIVLDQFAFDLPDLFTPNGDGVNDTVFVRFYGVKKLLQFEVYNRWGERVYENPGDLKQGWDGTFKGKPQNMDTYVVVASGENFHGEVRTIKKHLTLYR